MLTLTVDDQPLAYAVGDVPSSPILLTVEGEDTWTGVTVSPGAATLDGDTISYTPPALTEAGILTVAITLTGVGKSAAAGPLRLVVEDPADGWLTLDQARQEWADAPDDDVVLFEVLASARIACAAFAPAVETVPVNYRRAQVVQARSVWAAERPTFDNMAGDETHAIALYPLDWNVKQLLRPKPGVPVMW